jgi:hypothetical protein
VAGVRPELPDLSAAQLPALGSEVLGAATRVVVDEKAPAGRFTLGLVRQPGAMVEAIQQVVHDPRVIALQRDGTFWEEVERGAVSAALARPATRALVGDRAFRARLATIGPRLQAVRSDPALLSLLEDPAVRESLQSGNTLALLNDERFRALVARATR